MSIKNIEVLVSVKYYRRGNKVFQHFCFEQEKNKKYILEPRFILQKKLEEKIKEFAYDKGVFLNRRDEKDKIVLEFELDEIPDLPNGFFFKVVDFTPSTFTCIYCLHSIERDNKGKEELCLCAFQSNKIINKEVKNCKFFKQRRLFKT
jgi:hypothetical protein